jgi:hypothetical protein
VRLAFLFALATLSASACVTAGPVVRVYPDTPDVVWRSGRGIVERQGAAARVAMAFDHQDEDRLAFRVEVENTGADRVDIDPRNVSYVSCAGTACGAALPVMDPEQALVALDAARARERADAANSETASAVLLLLNVTASVAAVASGDGRAAGQFAAEGSRVAADAENRASHSDRTLSTIQAEKINWQVAALRRTTLFPGQGLAAEVYVPIRSTATALRVSVRVRGERFTFPFKQVVVYPMHQGEGLE